MIFLGQTFSRDNKCGKPNLIDTSNINSIQLENGIYDDLYITKTKFEVTNFNFNKEWDFNTIAHALFQNDLLAGNLEYSISTISSIRIKMREKGEFNWMTIKEIPINTVEDLKFIRTYQYCKGNTDYEFAIVPVLNGSVEGNFNILECKSEFFDAYIIEPDAALHMFINMSMGTQRNQSTAIVKTLGRNKPYYITNSQCIYDSGSINVTFIQLNEDCQLDITNAALYRRYVESILTDHKPKILKFADGRMWIIAITDAVSQSDSLDEISTHTINWSEIADCDSPYDMYVNGFHDVYEEEVT